MFSSRCQLKRQIWQGLAVSKKLIYRLYQIKQLHRRQINLNCDQFRAGVLSEIWLGSRLPSSVARLR